MSNTIKIKIEKNKKKKDDACSSVPEKVDLTRPLAHEDSLLTLSAYTYMRNLPKANLGCYERGIDDQCGHPDVYWWYNVPSRDMSSEWEKCDGDPSFLLGSDFEREAVLKFQNSLKIDLSARCLAVCMNTPSYAAESVHCRENSYDHQLDCSSRYSEAGQFVFLSVVNSMIAQCLEGRICSSLLNQFTRGFNDVNVIGLAMHKAFGPSCSFKTALRCSELSKENTTKMSKDYFSCFTCLVYQVSLKNNRLARSLVAIVLKPIFSSTMKSVYDSVKKEIPAYTELELDFKQFFEEVRSAEVIFGLIKMKPRLVLDSMDNNYSHNEVYPDHMCSSEIESIKKSRKVEWIPELNVIESNLKFSDGVASWKMRCNHGFEMKPMKCCIKRRCFNKKLCLKKACYEWYMLSEACSCKAFAIDENKE